MSGTKTETGDAGAACDGPRSLPSTEGMEPQAQSGRETWVCHSCGWAALRAGESQPGVLPAGSSLGLGGKPQAPGSAGLPIAVCPHLPLSLGDASLPLHPQDPRGSCPQTQTLNSWPRARMLE